MALSISYKLIADFQYIEEIGLVKEEFQERIYGLESEIKQAKYERESKETQIVALREQINKRVNEKVPNIRAWKAGGLWRHEFVTSRVNEKVLIVWI